MDASNLTCARLLALLIAAPAFAAGDEAAVSDLKRVKAICERTLGGLKPHVWRDGGRWSRTDSGYERVDVDVTPTGSLITTHKGTIEQVLVVTEKETYGTEQAARGATPSPVQTRVYYRTDLDYRDGRWYVRAGTTTSQMRIAGQVVNTDELNLTREDLLRPNGALGECKLGDAVR